MSAKLYRTKPVPTPNLPPGIPYIIGNEAAERFSFYGMKGILVVFMTTYLLGSDGELAVMDEATAKGWYHTFAMAVYFTPILGALLADLVLGKYRTILFLSIVYCFGHLALALDETRLGLAIGLSLIAFGAGGIKPCVSAHVGDQFGRTNSHWLSQVFFWFYFSINLGAASSMLITPWLLKHVGPGWAFGLPGILMGIATLFFFAGRHKFIHIPVERERFLKNFETPEFWKIILRLGVLYTFVAMFWALFDQTGSQWVLQAKNMNPKFLGFTWLPSQVQAVNPFLVMLFIPLFVYVVYPAIDSIWKLTPLRKIGLGLFLTVPAFLLPAWLELRIQAGEIPSIGWQFLCYAIITAAEVMVSITCLEFSYTQAPKAMKSFIMACFFLSVSIGNGFVALVNFFIRNDDGSVKLAGADYYYFFAGCMLVCAILFVPVAKRFVIKDILHEES